jgi:hypothetical protein
LSDLRPVGQSATLGGKGGLMPAKTRSPRARKVLSIEERFKAHLQAHERCEFWAKKALEHQRAGRTQEALAAYAKAERCLAKMMALEPKYPAQ